MNLLAHPKHKIPVSLEFYINTASAVRNDELADLARTVQPRWTHETQLQVHTHKRSMSSEIYGMVQLRLAISNTLALSKWERLENSKITQPSLHTRDISDIIQPPALDGRIAQSCSECRNTPISEALLECICFRTAVRAHRAEYSADRVQSSLGLRNSHLPQNAQRL